MRKKILIFNRGEIALRAAISAKTCHLNSVIILQKDDFSYLLEKNCHEVIYTDHKSVYTDLDYLDQFLKKHSIDYLYPGYGYLSEEPRLEKLCTDHNVCFIGPNNHCLSLLSDKKLAGELFNSWGVKTLSINKPLKDDYPIMLKAAMGGGGRGNSVVHAPEFLSEKLTKLKKKSLQLFQNDTILLERYLPAARHIEVQVFATSDNISIIGSRDCSLQINFQKIIEEGPALASHLKKLKLQYKNIMKGLKELGYIGLGTIEFLWDQSRDEIYFLEMNTRIQVEHTVTESLLSSKTNLDLVEKQINIFQDNLNLPSIFENNKEIGHAINLRIYAVDDNDNFKPDQGFLHYVDIPKNIRFDHTLSENEYMSSDFDPLLGKLVVKGKNRSDCIKKAIQDLISIKIFGVKTNKAYLLQILKDQNFINNTHTISYLTEKNKTKTNSKVLDKGTLEGIRSLFNMNNLNKKLEYDGFTITLAPNGQLWIEDNLTLEVITQDFYPSIMRNEKNNKDQKHIISPVTGIIREVIRKPFESINKGEIILTVESMKMFFDIEAPKSGVLQDFTLKTGSSVNSGEILIRID